MYNFGVFTVPVSGSFLFHVLCIPFRKQQQQQDISN